MKHGVVSSKSRRYFLCLNEKSGKPETDACGKRRRSCKRRRSSCRRKRRRSCPPKKRRCRRSRSRCKSKTAIIRSILSQCKKKKRRCRKRKSPCSIVDQILKSRNKSQRKPEGMGGWCQRRRGLAAIEKGGRRTREWVCGVNCSQSQLIHRYSQLCFFLFLGVYDKL
ncbi:hypothetical protein C0J52_09360 [Blattella germanica]|nr:hypothetical protein C0J52_09360 [Blattella germanica]